MSIFSTCELMVVFDRQQPPFVDNSHDTTRYFHRVPAAQSWRSRVARWISRHLRYFVAVADLGGFTSAAAAVGGVQSSVSFAIGRLEDELGVVLFERTTRSVAPTEIALALLPLVRDVLVALDEGVAAAGAADAAIDDRQLRYFVAVAEADGFTRASERAGVTQSALSKSVRRLERDLDTALFTRTARSLLLTEAGAAMLPHARAVLDALSHVRVTARDAGENRGPRLHVGALPIPIDLDVARVAGEFHLRRPDVQLQLVQRAGPHELVAQVNSGELDFAITAFVGSAPAGVTFEVLTSEPFQLIVNRSIRSPDDLSSPPSCCAASRSSTFRPVPRSGPRWTPSTRRSASRRTSSSRPTA